MRVAIIGAGAAGLTSAEELLRVGIDIVIFERADTVGGIWNYTTEVERDPLGQVPDEERIHASIYDGLRTNLPRDVMAFDDFPMGTLDEDERRYPGHRTIARYLANYAASRDLGRHIRFNARVTECRLHDDEWIVSTPDATDRFDGLVVCNGHYSVPHVPDLPGIDGFNGRILHSHNYREPTPFVDRTVALLGTAASGVDLAKEIGDVARKVYWSGPTFESLTDDRRRADNVTYAATVERFDGDRLVFRNGKVSEPVDDFVFCTGFHYRFPFLPDVDTSRDWVPRLYREVLSIDLTNLAFIGLPYRVVPFPLCQIQARWLAALWAGHFELPSRAELEAHYTQFIAERSDEADRHFHRKELGCWDYLAGFAQEANVRGVAPWRRDLIETIQRHVEANPRGFRDIPFDPPPNHEQRATVDDEPTNTGG